MLLAYPETPNTQLLLQRFYYCLGSDVILDYWELTLNIKFDSE